MFLRFFLQKFSKGVENRKSCSKIKKGGGKNDCGQGSKGGGIKFWKFFRGRKKGKCAQKFKRGVEKWLWTGVQMGRENILEFF